jgi:3-oxoacyl-[acyl-carrier-protein] synthase II
MRRVVITGMGTVSPLGSGTEHNWKALLAGKSGISTITHFNTDDLVAKIAGTVPIGQGEGEFDMDGFLSQKEQRKMSQFIIFALKAAEEAIEDAGWKPTKEEDLIRTGVIIGSGIGGINDIAESALILNEKGPRRISPFFIPSSLINLASGHVSIKYGFMGPNHSVVTACATGTHSIGDASRLIMFGDADVMIAGGTESTVSKLSMSGFAAARALSTNFNDTPKKASRPWDKDRDGFVMGEGAGILVLEEYEHAKKRGAKIYAEVTGYGLSGDAYHITSPEPNGRGAILAMKAAIRNAAINPEDIDYINAHGTSTPMGDEIEANTVQKLFGDHSQKLSMSSTKSSTGHLLGAAGSLEAIFSILAIRDGVAPATLNLDNQIESCNIDLVPNTPKERTINIALSNSFGFGGTNASVIFKKLQ